MTAVDKRQVTRTNVRKIETVGVYRDGRELSYEEIFHQIEDTKSPHALFNVVALVRDVSQKGFGVMFEGQQVLAGILLRPGDRYILKLTLIMPPITEAVAPYFKLDDNYHYLLLKVACCWSQQQETLSRAGFDLVETNPPEILEFVREYFNLD